MSTAYPYSPHIIEQEAQQYWDHHRCFQVNDRDTSRQKFYGLCAFPYPSGDLHVGHIRNYVLGDVGARYQRMCHKQVLNPIGWDAFGLPAENAAIQKGIDPAEWTTANILRMRTQLKRLGLSYDWNRELATCDPEYYRWEQWLFIKLFEKGVAYRKTSWVNWDPIDQTILSNEQVIQGRGWRSGALVERKAIPQWFLKITDYADILLQELESLPEWPEAVKTMQHHWIGRSKGMIVTFPLLDSVNNDSLEVFTTRIETIMGVSYLAISPEHPLTQQLASHNTTIKIFAAECLAIPTAESAVATQEKLGLFTGHYAKHPLTQEKLPIWIANFVEKEYGTGAVMAVPAHDQRDFTFAQQYQLPCLPVIAPLDDTAFDYRQAPFIEKGRLINSGNFTGLQTEAAIQAITQHLVTRGLAYAKTHYRLRDWGISRQRYWGAPIPIIYCDHCGVLPVPEKDLPITLPKLPASQKGQAPAPLSQLPEFYKTRCPQCHRPARRETDTFDTFVESSWYFIRFLCPQAHQMISEDTHAWLPVDHYTIGIEHAVLHLLYSRFFYKLFHTLGLLKTPEGIPQEPFRQILTQGMVLQSGTKMSKSKGNVVEPTPLIDQYGADTLRLFILFAAPPTQSLEWSNEGLLGSHRFLKRLWQLVNSQLDWLMDATVELPAILSTEQKALRTQIHSLLTLTSQDYQRYQFNTAIANCMKLLNLLQSAISHLSATEDTVSWQPLIKEGVTILLRLLAPIVPHVTHVLWSRLYHSENILEAPWPEVDAIALVTQQLTVVIQINGRKRAVLTVPTNTPIDQIKQKAQTAEVIQPYLKNTQIKKMILVPTKPNVQWLLNIVTAAVSMESDGLLNTN
jgi:leucyl-tRNA synthetase